VDADKHKIYYVVIVGNVSDDHLCLRRIINKMFPQAIVESLYLNEESLSFLAHHCQAPDLVFLQYIAVDSPSFNLYNKIKTQIDFQQVPIILIGDEAEEKVDSVVAKKLKTGYFKRSFQLNTIDWLARNLIGKYDQLIQMK
jgi:PleD family two-component response regulator